MVVRFPAVAPERRCCCLRWPRLAHGDCLLLPTVAASCCPRWPPRVAHGGRLVLPTVTASCWVARWCGPRCRFASPVWGLSAVSLKMDSVNIYVGEQKFHKGHIASAQNWEFQLLLCFSFLLKMSDIKIQKIKDISRIFLDFYKLYFLNVQQIRKSWFCEPEAIAWSVLDISLHIFPGGGPGGRQPPPGGTSLLSLISVHRCSVNAPGLFLFGFSELQERACSTCTSHRIWNPSLGGGGRPPPTAKILAQRLNRYVNVGFFFGGEGAFFIWLFFIHFCYIYIYIYKYILSFFFFHELFSNYYIYIYIIFYISIIINLLITIIIIIIWIGK